MPFIFKEWTKRAQELSICIKLIIGEHWLKSDAHTTASYISCIVRARLIFLFKFIFVNLQHIVQCNFTL